jgi:hypothetical protein
MHDDHMPRRFPWFRLAFGAISILVLIGTFGGFMWLLRTYVDPPRIAATPPAPSAAALLASASHTTSSAPSQPRVIMAAPDDPQTLPSIRSEPAPPNSGAPIPSWTGSPLPGAPKTFAVASSPSTANSPPAATEAGTVSLDGPVPLPRPKPSVAVRVQLPAAAPLPRPRPPA